MKLYVSTSRRIMTTTNKNNNLLRLIALTILLLGSAKTLGQKFQGRAKSFGVEVVATAGATTLSLKPPTSSVKASGGKFEYDITDASLGPVPPFFDNVLAMAQVKGPKLNVKGEYPKWKPKAVKESHKKKGKHNSPQQATSMYEPARHMTTANINSLQKKRERRSRESFYKNGQKPIELTRERNSRSIIEKEEAPQQIIEHVAEISRSMRSIRNAFQKTLDSVNTKSSRIEKRDVDSNSKGKSRNHGNHGSDIQAYAHGMGSRVNHVINEAKEVLSNTGKVVNGLRKIISGAKKLTEFSENAVKFAKYFAMEPSNATVDYFEEKAVIAVLQAQKAAAEAKIAAVMAREAAQKAEAMVKKMKKAGRAASSVKLSKAVKFIKIQAENSAAAAKETSSQEEAAQNDAVVVDRALRKMVELTEEEVNRKRKKKEHEREEERKDEQIKRKEEKERNNNEDERKSKEEESKGEKYISDREETEKSQSLEEDQEATSKSYQEKELAESESTTTTQDESSGEKETQEDTGLKDLYENVKTELEGTDRSNSSTDESTDASEMLTPSLLQGGGDENEVIANDFKTPVQVETIEQRNYTEPKVIEAATSAIKNGSLNVVVNVQRKQVPLDSNKSSQGPVYDPFNFRSILNSKLNGESHQTIDPFNFAVKTKEENARSVIPDAGIMRRMQLLQGSDKKPSMKSQVSLSNENKSYNAGLYDERSHKKRSRIPVYGYAKSQYYENRSNPGYFMLLT